MRKGGLSVDQPQSALAIDPRGDQSHYATRTVPSFPCTWKEGQPEGSLSVLDPLHRAVRLSCRAVWQYNVSVMDISAPPLRLTLGPLRYEFRAHDAWGQEALAGLRRNLDSVAFSNVPDRITHLLDCRLTPQEHAQIDAGDLPDCLVALLPENSPRQGWELTGDESGYLSWCHARTCHAIWSYNTVRVEYHARFQLPWQTLLRDIVALGGGILHGGLVALHGRGAVSSRRPLGAERRPRFPDCPRPGRCLLMMPRLSGRPQAVPSRRVRCPPGAFCWGGMQRFRPSVVGGSVLARH